MNQTQTILKVVVKEGVALTCSWCGYPWTYKGSLIYANCPSCRRGVRVEDSKVNKNSPKKMIGGKQV